jgi:TRAP-type uncharacterized transport system substrate-binding protein
MMRAIAVGMAGIFAVIALLASPCHSQNIPLLENSPLDSPQLTQPPAQGGETLVVAKAQNGGRPGTSPLTARSVGELDNVNRINNWTVGVAGGLLEGTFIKFAAELAKALDAGDNLRVLPIVTYGAAENVSDLLYLKGVDISITHADVFEEFKRSGKASDIDKRVNYISQMYVGELHIFARPEIKSLSDLAGKKVGFHTKGAGPTITGPILFERLGIKVEPVFINNTVALEQMKTGEIAAILHTVGKPNDLFTKLKAENYPGFHFLAVEYTDKFSDYYTPSTLGHDDYPTLFKPGESIETIGIPVVLAVYNWPRTSDRFRRVERFIQYYFSHFDKLKQPPFHAKWKEINLAGKIPGWNRYWVAEELLNKEISAHPPVPSKQAPSAAITGAPSASTPDSSAATGAPEKSPLYKEFLDWKKRQNK